jgi:putative ABC transport system permease protein
MTRFAIRGLLSRKLRTALTAVAIVLGVAMISGTYVLTDSIDQAFDKIFTDIRKGSSAVITGRSAFDLSDGSGVTDPTLDESLLGEVRELPSVAQAEGSVDSDATQLIGDDGKAIVSGGAPNLGFSIASGDSDFNPLTLVQGAWPGPEEVVVDKETAADQDFGWGRRSGFRLKARSSAYESPESWSSAPASRSAERRWLASICQPHSACSRRSGGSTRSPSRRSPTCPTPSS